MNLEKPYSSNEQNIVEEGDYIGFDCGSDLNKEICDPGVSEAWPNGVVAIRADDSFWVVAFLPYEEFADKSMAEIAGVFWPNFTAISFNPDTKTT